jgi:CheY-like chemotaxis protein
MKRKSFLLIAEDDPDDQLLFRDAIEVVCAPTLETRFVWDGFELLNFLRANPGYQPGLVILDLNMPGKDGRTALQEIKADPNLTNIPVVVLTTSHDETDLQYCLDYGVIEYYSKPGSMGELKEIFRRLCIVYLN